MSPPSPPIQTAVGVALKTNFRWKTLSWKKEFGCKSLIKYMIIPIQRRWQATDRATLMHVLEELEEEQLWLFLNLSVASRCCSISPFLRYSYFQRPHSKRNTADMTFTMVRYCIVNRLFQWKKKKKTKWLKTIKLYINSDQPSPLVRTDHKGRVFALIVANHGGSSGTWSLDTYTACLLCQCFISDFYV